MKLTIIPSDGAVYKEGVSLSHLTLENIPSNVHALQWNVDQGWVEYKDGTPNKIITQLPDWAVSSVNTYEDTLASITAEKQALNNPPVLSYDKKLFLIKVERDKRLTATDWTQLSDVIAMHNESWLTAWKAYRQALRDLPESITDIDNVVFPLPPT